MLQDIIKSAKDRAFFLIEDENSARGEDLFKAILKIDTENSFVEEIHLICCEKPPELYLNGTENLKIIKYNCFNDPCGWLKNESNSCHLIINKLLDTKARKASTVMIDSLNSLFCSEKVSLNNIFCMIQTLKENFMKVTSIIHRDVIKNPESLRKFKYFSNVILTVQTEVTKQSRHYTVPDTNNKLVEIIYKKPNGKFVFKKEIFKINSNAILYSEEVKKENDMPPSNVKENMQSLTTFRLGLKMLENEKIAKKNLVLPYLRVEKKEEEEEEGKIIYCADANDDLEEDPDDDLDI